MKLALITLVMVGSAFAQSAPSPQPQLQPLQRVTVVRSGCEGNCANYTVHLDIDGTVTYEGQGFVKVFGTRTWKVPEISVRKVFTAAGNSDLLPSDQPLLITSKGECKPVDGTPERPLVHVGLTLGNYNHFPAATCYSESVARVATLMDEVTGASLYATGHDEASEAAIRAVLNEQVEAWNRGDLEGYMAGYWMSPELTFASGATPTKGWTSTLERYRKAYKSQGKQMGTLAFDGVMIEMLSPDAAFVRGQWKLAMSGGKSPHGLFTLVVRKFPNGWRIVHDHSSGE